MAEENQVTKEPQQVTQVTKNHNEQLQRTQKVGAGKRLAESYHRRREVKKREEQAKLEKSEYSSGSDRWPWLLHLLVQESRATLGSQRSL